MLTVYALQAHLHKSLLAKICNQNSTCQGCIADSSDIQDFCRRDLSFLSHHKMSVRILEPYIHRCTHEPGLTLLTSVLQTPTNWLLVRFLTEILPDASQGNTIPRGKGHNIVFVSIWRSYEFWTEIATKCVRFNQAEYWGRASIDN